MLQHLFVEEDKFTNTLDGCAYIGAKLAETVLAENTVVVEVR
mgnify:CR=1 FL=1